MTALLPLGDWRFDEIKAEDPARAAALETAGSPDALLSELEAAFRRAALDGNLRRGWEQARDARGGDRALMQFYVGEWLFDSLFNGRTGYRAHFRASARQGLAFNDRIVASIRESTQVVVSPVVVARKLIGEFEDAGEVRVERATFLDSLRPTLSKLWYCSRRLRLSGGSENLTLGVTGPGIRLSGDERWSAIYPEDESCWVDVYGAFVGAADPYQPKDPFKRAELLHARGTA